MTETSERAARRAERLLRWYPEGWRSRYGDEFAELLITEFSEQPRSWRRGADVAVSALVARLSGTGLTGRALEPSDQVRAGLASFGCALAAFLVLGMAMWSQLAIGWQWSRPDALGTSVAMVVMSATMALFTVLALLAAVPIAWGLLGRVIRRQSRGLLRPASLFLFGAAILVAGSRHFGNGWPGTGGHPWTHQGLVPGGVAAFAWASTMSVSAYWIHPGALLSFPTEEIAWMAVSPVAMVCLVVGAVKTIRRMDLSPRVLHYERWLGAVAAVGMTVFFTGSACWVVDGGPGPKNLFHAGAIDVAGLVFMTGALVVSYRAVLRARSADLPVLAR